MLLIPDIHITARYEWAICTYLQDYVDRHDDNQIVLMGDYVYHFSYQRSALMRLFELFLSRAAQGKDIYILAGNHDWLSSHFVYHEWLRAFSLIQDKHIHFITTPEHMVIDDKNIFFLPYQLQPDLPEITDTMRQTFPELVIVVEELIKQWETHSAAINLQALQGFIDHPDMTLIHHYYVANTVFPGQKTRFSFKDHALSELWLMRPDLRIISGHIHRPFSDRNYLCTGSLRYTSPGETNHIKYCFAWDCNDTLIATPLLINPYLQYDIADGERFDSDTFAQLTADITHDSAKTLTQSSQRDIIPQSPTWKQEDVSLSLRWSLSYDTMTEQVDTPLSQSLKDIKIRQKHAKVADLLDQLTKEKEQFSGWWQDRKNMLVAYLNKKYPDAVDEYLALLTKLDIKVS